MGVVKDVGGSVGWYVKDPGSPSIYCTHLCMSLKFIIREFESDGVVTFQQVAKPARQQNRVCRISKMCMVLALQLVKVAQWAFLFHIANPYGFSVYPTF